MANRQKRESELSEGIKGISKLAGTLVGTVVVTGKRIVNSTGLSSQGAKGKSRKKSIRVTTKKKSAVKPKAAAVKKKKVVKRKTGGVSKKKPAKSPAKKKATAAKKKATSKTKKTIKGSVSSQPKKSQVPKKVLGTIAPIEQQEP